MDQAVECIKNILDSNRCRICDRAEGSRLRYPCGHTACDACIVEAPDCLICVTPPNGADVAAVDEPFTLRANNALALKETFEETFNIGVYERLRLSEQLKIERELFPSCIQAPVTYHNKHKSIKTSSENKENISFLQHSGQEISSKKMDTEKSKYLQQWLDNIDTRHRKPFADIDVNRSLIQQNARVKKRADIILDKAYEKSGFQVQKSPSKKRTHFKKSLSLVNSQTKLNKYLKPLEKQETPKWTAKKFQKDFDPPKQPLNIDKNDKDESGVVMDDEVISINDSQSQVVDKDREAWLAVLKAGDKDVSEPTLNLQCSENIRYTIDVENSLTRYEEQNTSTSTNIPLIKQSSLSKSCQPCNDVVIESDLNETAGQSKKVSITIESNSFIATITVSTEKISGESKSKQSAYVQTDIQGLLENQAIETKSDDADVSKRCVDESQDLFTAEGTEEKNKIDNITVEKCAPAPNIIKISDSESDDLNQSSIIEVTADVHRSSGKLDYGVLSEVDQKELGSRTTKPKKRGKTPASSNSSEKENFDPNKSKRRRVEKKSTKKKRANKTKFK